MEEIYQEILRVVEDVTGIPANFILKSNKEEHVDARHILVYLMYKVGFSDTKISYYTKLTRPCVCTIRNLFKYRLQRYFVKLQYNKAKSALTKCNVIN